MTEQKDADAVEPVKRRRWLRIVIMLMTMGYVFPHALIE